jgi:hypothetical protein
MLIVAPDADQEWTHRTLEDKELRKVTGIYDEHWYVTREEVASGRIEERCRDRIRLIKSLDPNKDFILGELGIVDGKTDEDKQPNVFNFWYGMTMADAAIQLLRGGCAGFIAWYLDDSMHFLGDGDVVVRDGSSLPANAYELRKVWGLWNSLGGQHGDPGDEQLRPWFYTWSLLSRCFPAGCKVVECRVSNSGEHRVAAACVQTGEMLHVSLAIVSYIGEKHTIRLSATGIDDSVDLAVYEYFDCDDDNRVDAWPVTVDERGADVFPTPVRWLKDVDLCSEIDVEFPGKGVVVLTSMGGNDSFPVPVCPR